MHCTLTHKRHIRHTLEHAHTHSSLSLSHVPFLLNIVLFQLDLDPVLDSFEPGNDALFVVDVLTAQLLYF